MASRAAAAAPRIQRLQPSVVAQVRSGLVIGCFRQAAVELVSNALVATFPSTPAAAITVVLDVAGGCACVTDNGPGMPTRDMELLGLRYCTSKGGVAMHGHATLGFRGEALWALAEASRSVRIVSSARGSLESFSKTLTGQGAPSQLRPSGPDERLPRCGTSVMMTGFMHNQPVRLRQAQPSDEGVLADAMWSIFWLVLPHSGVLLVVKGKGGALLLEMARGRTMVSAVRSADRELLYVNGRPVSNPLITSVVHQHFQHAVGRHLQRQPAGSQQPDASKLFPGFLLQLTCPPADVCINSEPDKVLVTFKSIDVVVALLREVLTRRITGAAVRCPQSRRASLASIYRTENPAAAAVTRAASGPVLTMPDGARHVGKELAGNYTRMGEELAGNYARTGEELVGSYARVGEELAGGYARAGEELAGGYAHAYGMVGGGAYSDDAPPCRQPNSPADSDIPDLPSLRFGHDLQLVECTHPATAQRSPPDRSQRLASGSRRQVGATRSDYGLDADFHADVGRGHHEQTPSSSPGSPDQQNGGGRTEQGRVLASYWLAHDAFESHLDSAPGGVVIGAQLSATDLRFFLIQLSESSGAAAVPDAALVVLKGSAPPYMQISI
ncbi:hypothetical protein FOA52_014774 [Chlamydomonas sp. UWO 241]|nr:hypothetical protein FOA52_014774 [Chlamydomonas sp. UWO 241]